MKVKVNFIPIISAAVLLLASGPLVAQDSLFVDSAGDIGVGTSTPSQPLHVQRTDTASILVENTTAAVAARTLFELSNAGNTKFLITNLDALNSWAFTNSGTDFRISLQASGKVEFTLDNGGDLTIAGEVNAAAFNAPSDRALKQDFSSIDDASILSKLARLQIDEWSYIADPSVRHIGPVAQDFKAVFGLGSSDTTINLTDSMGIALAAARALAVENYALKAGHRELLRAWHQQQDEIEALNAIKSQMDSLKAEQAELKAVVTSILRQQSNIELTSSDE